MMNIKSKSSKILILAIILLCIPLVYIIINRVTVTSNSIPKSETITFPSVDGLEITADLYLIDDNAPLIILFHQAHLSRGEYLEIAPRLNELGYNAMAVDTRTGSICNEIINETAKRADEDKIDTTYSDILMDMEASIKYANVELGYDKIITWGSSYSASLVIGWSQNYSDIVRAVIAFSPGYLEIENESFKEYARKLTLPVFITGIKYQKNLYLHICNLISSERKVSFVPESCGVQGSPALWEETEGHEEYWEAVINFLDSLEMD